MHKAHIISTDGRFLEEVDVGSEWTSREDALVVVEFQPYILGPFLVAPGDRLDVEQDNVRWRRAK